MMLCRVLFLIVFLCHSKVSSSIEHTDLLLPSQVQEIRDKVISWSEEGFHVTAEQQKEALESLNVLTRTRVVGQSDVRRIAALAAGETIAAGASRGVVIPRETALTLTLHERNNSIIYIQSIDAEIFSIITSFAGVILSNEDPSSHPSIILRQAGIPAITQINSTIAQSFFGKIVVLDGTHGTVFNDEDVKLQEPEPDDYKAIKYLTLKIQEKNLTKVFGNADSVRDIKKSIDLGSKGIDLRTEYMFNSELRCQLVTALLHEKDSKPARAAVEFIKLQSQKIFEEMINLMDGESIFNIRLLDPPTHEFLPVEPSKEFLSTIGMTSDEFVYKKKYFSEVNPMLGKRGVRLLISRPDLLLAQISSIILAIRSSLRTKEASSIPKVNIIIPMVSWPEEIKVVNEKFCALKKYFSLSPHEDEKIGLGIMVETPSATQFSKQDMSMLSWASFGTNDLTAMTFGVSRGEVYEQFLSSWLSNKIVIDDPFVHISSSVESQVCSFVCRIRKNESSALGIGMCGEQARSFPNKGQYLNSISVNPFEIPQASIEIYFSELNKTERNL